MSIIVNADDLGISPGCAAAAARCAAAGGINSVSFLANGEYLDVALKHFSQTSKIAKGVHLNLTYGPALAGKTSIASDGMLRNSYFKLFLLSLFSRRFAKDVELEFECQIRHLLAEGVRITHLDSHRHVHMIPAIFGITAKLAEKYGIPRIRRSCDEKLLLSILARGTNRTPTFAGLAKWTLMKIFGLFIKKEAKPSTIFMSTLYSGAISAAMLEKAENSGRKIEIAVHPGIPALDAEVDFHDESEEAYWLSDDRTLEFDACMTFASSQDSDKT